MKGEKGIQGDNSDVLSALADNLPIQLATRYGEKICLVIELSGGVVTLCNITAYHEPAWHFDAKFKGMKWQTYRKQLVMVIFRDEELGIPLSL